MIEANLVMPHQLGMANAQEKLLADSTYNEMRPERIGSRLAILRVALGLTPSQIADDLGIERTYWSRFENGKRQLNDTTAALLCDRYGVTLDFLILGKWTNLPLDLARKMRDVEASLKNN